MACRRSSLVLHVVETVHAVSDDVLPRILERVEDLSSPLPVIPVMVWSASGINGTIVDRRGIPFTNDHVMDGLGNFHLVVADSDLLHWEDLLRSNVWDPSCRYIVLLLETEPCSSANPTVSRIPSLLWDRHSVRDSFVMSTSCPHLVQYLAADFSRQTLVAANLSLVEPRLTSLLNFKGSILQVGLNNYTPTAVVTNEIIPGRGRKVVGMDGFMLQAFGEYLNFTWHLVRPKDGITHGYITPNGTVTGTLALVVNNTVAVAFNNRFVMDYGTNEILFSTPHEFDWLCIGVQRSEQMPKYLALVTSFTMGLWGTILVSFIAASLVWWALYPSRGLFHAMVDVAYVAFAGELCISMEDTFGRLLAASLFNFHVVVVMGCFQATLFTSRTSPRYFAEVDTLEQLDKSGMEIVTGYYGFRNVFDVEENALMQRLNSKLRAGVDEGEALRKKPRTGIFVRASSAYFDFSLVTDQPSRMRMMKECPKRYLLGFIVPKRTALLDQLNHFILRCFNAGLIQVWKARTYSSAVGAGGRDQVVGASDLNIAFADVESAFFVLAIGFIISSVVFLLEIVSCTVKKIRDRVMNCQHFFEIP